MMQTMQMRAMTTADLAVAERQWREYIDLTREGEHDNDCYVVDEVRVRDRKRARGEQRECEEAEQECAEESARKLQRVKREFERFVRYEEESAADLARAEEAGRMGAYSDDEYESRVRPMVRDTPRAEESDWAMAALHCDLEDGELARPEDETGEDDEDDLTSSDGEDTPAMREFMARAGYF